MTVLGRYAVGRPVGVAPSVRPAHVVQDEERQRTRRGPLGDQAELPAHRVVVVIAVDDRGVREPEPLQRVMASRPHELEIGPLTRELLELRLWGRIDRRDRRAAAVGPCEELAGEVSGVRAHLDDEPRVDRVEQRHHDLEGVRQRVPPVAGVVSAKLRHPGGPVYGAGTGAGTAAPAIGRADRGDLNNRYA